MANQKDRTEIATATRRTKARGQENQSDLQQIAGESLLAHYYGLAQGYKAITQRAIEHLRFLHDRKPTKDELRAKERTMQIEGMISQTMIRADQAQMEAEAAVARMKEVRGRFEVGSGDLDVTITEAEETIELLRAEYDVLEVDLDRVVQ